MNTNENYIVASYQMLRKAKTHVSCIRAAVQLVGEGQIAWHMTAHQLLNVTLEMSLETFQWSRRCSRCADKTFTKTRSKVLGTIRRAEDAGYF